MADSAAETRPTRTHDGFNIFLVTLALLGLSLAGVALLFALINGSDETATSTGTAAVTTAL